MGISNQVFILMLWVFMASTLEFLCLSDDFSSFSFSMDGCFDPDQVDPDGICTLEYDPV